MAPGDLLILLKGNNCIFDAVWHLDLIAIPNFAPRKDAQAQR
jgi:hypothetical protein